MELICNSCFLTPGAAPAVARGEVSEMIVCSHDGGGVSVAEGEAGVLSLRCGQCGSKVRLERHHLTWYGL